MKRLISLVALGAVLGFGAHAEDVVPTLTITGTFEPVKIAVADISRITFDGTTMVVDKAGGNLSIDIADVTDMVFDGLVSAQESIAADFADEFIVSFDYGVMSLSVADGKTVDMGLYNAGGQCVAAQSGIHGEWSMLLQDLPGGVYIIRLNNRTFKFTR